jgi:bifunctional non-homologous end joining protein LigD
VLVCECNFAEWTSDGIVRQASFVSLRNDKPARQIIKEAPRKGADVQEQTDTASDDVPKERTTRKAIETSSAEPAKKSAAKVPATETPATKSTAAKSKSAVTPAEVAGVRISHPDRIIDKSSGARKIDLVEYYQSVADWMLPHLHDRPVSLVRAPEDIGGELFFQRHSQKLSIPNFTQHPGLDPGHPPLITVDTLKALIGAAQMGTIEFHTWNGVVSNIEKPDRMVFDLDPDASLGWERMIEAAQLTRSLLEELGLNSFCKTSGGKGFHVVVPLAKYAGWDEVKAFSQAVAQHMATKLPKYFSAKMGAQNRKQKIFVDYLRNNRGSSTVAAFSARARPGLGVSVPLSWEEVATTTSGDQWTIENVHERLEDLKRDPWADYAKTRQRITAAMKKRLDEAE